MKFIFSILLFLGFAGQGFSQQVTLDYFLTQARANSPVTRDFQNQLLSNRIDSQLLRSSLRTQVNFINANSYAPVIKGYGYDAAITNIANLTAILQASRNIVGRKNRTEQFRAIALQNQALKDSLALSERELVRGITDQYVTTLGDQLTVSFNKEVFDLMQKEETILKKLTQAGTYKQTDYLSFYVTLQQQELLYVQAEQLYSNDYLTLYYLCGLQDTAIQPLAKPVYDSLETPNIQETVFYKRFATDSLRIKNQETLTALEYKPKVSAFADAGYNSSLQVTPYRNMGFSAGINLTIPIYDGHQRRLKMNKLSLQENTRKYQQDFFMAQYNQQMAQLHQQLRLIDQFAGKIEHQITYAYTLVRANNKMMETGDISMKDYITAINNYLAAKNLLTQNYVARLKIVSQLNYWNR